MSVGTIGASGGGEVSTTAKGVQPPGRGTSLVSTLHPALAARARASTASEAGTEAGGTKTGTETGATLAAASPARKAQLSL
jgi:hypothetical protein